MLALVGELYPKIKRTKNKMDLSNNLMYIINCNNNMI